MMESDPHQKTRTMPIETPHGTLFGVLSVLFATLTAVSFALYGLSGALALSLIVFAAMAGFAVQGIGYHPHASLGTANGITATRGAMAAFLAGAVVDPQVVIVAGWQIFVVAVVAFALDGADGFFARREKLMSRFGARFDMEVDVALAAILSLVLLVSGKAGPEILALGFMRYAFVAAGFVFPWLNNDLPERFRRKTICVLQIGALIFLLCPLAPTASLMPVSAIVSLALVWSFALDVLWLKRAA